MLNNTFSILVSDWLINGEWRTAAGLINADNALIVEKTLI
jgi:hypothetical protein